MPHKLSLAVSLLSLTHVFVGLSALTVSQIPFTTAYFSNTIHPVYLSADSHSYFSHNEPLVFWW